MPLSASTVTMVCPGPRSLASRIAPATLMPDEPPRQRPSCLRRSKMIGRASVSGIWKASSIGAPSKFLVMRPWPMPSVIELPSAFRVPVL
ncbi:hypothetical protein D3C83_112900 [compost metagenome]